MKYVVFLGDGMGDYAYEQLDGKTPLQAATTPHMDWLAQHGDLGLVHTIPDGFPPGSDVGNMTVLGYDPSLYYTGRAPIEAASMGLKLGPTDIAYRCNLVHLEERDGQLIMEDYSAGHIKNDYAHRLLSKIKQELDSDVLTFEPGINYRHILVWKNGPTVQQSTPPHDILGKPIQPYLPQGDGDVQLLELMKKSQEILKGEQANAIWLWGCGPMPQLPSFASSFGPTGAIISAVDLIKGLGVLAELEVPDIPGVTGYLDTNYQGKVDATLNTLKEHDFVYVHVEAPDETGHEGDLNKKIQALDDFDAKVVGPILKQLSDFGDHAVLLLPDHYTPVKIRTHVANPVPFALYRSTQPQSHPERHYAEPDAAQTGLKVSQGHQLMKQFIQP